MTTEEYVAAQKEWIERARIHKGSKVRITRVAMTGENGWDNAWTGSMGDSVGRVGVVCSMNNAGKSGEVGIRVCVEGGHAWYFPCFVLEPIIEERDILNLLAKWLSRYPDCPFGDDHVCEFRRAEQCWDIRSYHPECWINAAKEVLIRGYE